MYIIYRHVLTPNVSLKTRDVCYRHSSTWPSAPSAAARIPGSPTATYRPRGHLHQWGVARGI